MNTYLSSTDLVSTDVRVAPTCRSDVLKMVVELYDCEPRMFKEQFDKVASHCHLSP